MSTLDDLKRAIDVAYRLRTQSITRETELRVAERDAWRMAFEWRAEFGNSPNRDCSCRHCRLNSAEYDQGMALIREKLS